MHSIIETAKDFGVDVEWAVSRRKEYLDREITRKELGVNTERATPKSKEYLERKIAELKNDQQAALQLLSGKNELSRFILMDTIKILNKEIKKYEMELSFKNTGKNSRITQGDIGRAKAYPIENLLQNIRNGITHCISGTHEDRHPSMDIRNNFAHCYSCGWYGDTIAVYMQINDVDFITAVKTLIG
ncbi:MAG: hypothetical protein E3K36_06390 [Candidatus Brocadia sp.]|nr:hypothetical protein [Candidatus Brocadia sp.]